MRNRAASNEDSTAGFNSSSVRHGTIQQKGSSEESLSSFLQHVSAPN